MGSRVTLSADDLVLAHERTTVVHGVSVHLQPGVVTALVGPNGSGKSTLSRSLARRHRVGSGRISLADGAAEAQDIAALSAREFATKVTLAVLLGFADAFGRSMIAPAQIPAGLAVALVGAPYSCTC